jgi:CDP-2,3-bis-(O-geranylgeranyl)-sn-glycerol synthase
MMENFFLYLLKIIYLIIPGVFANMAPILVKNKFKKLAHPVDFNKTLGGKPILGTHKTFRGFIFGILFGILVVYVQQLLYSIEFFSRISILDYSSYNFVLLGFLVGFGALFGDSVKSFFKRRCNLKPGKSFFPWDQIDAPIGAIIFISFIYKFSFSLIVGIIIVSLLSHLLIRTVGYYLGINKERW